MTQPISLEQWQALRAQGWSDAQIMAHYHYDPAPPKPVPPPASAPIPGFDAPALPGPAVPSFAAPSTAPLDLSDGKFGVAEGRHPEDGRHTIKIVGFDRHRSARDGMDLVIVEYVIEASTNPANEIGGRYSKAYATRPRANDYGKSRDALKGLIADIAKHAIPGCRPETMASVEWNATVADVIGGKGVGVRGTLATRTTKTAAGFDFVTHDWTIGKTDDVGPARPAAPPQAPGLTLPPMPAGAPPLPPMPAASSLPPMPSAAPPMPGAPPKPPGWMGPWPPGGAS